MSVNPSISIPGYTIHRLLGQGGMAKVYLATQDSLQRNVAIKVLLNPSDELFAKRFMAEARTIAALNNPRVITIYDVAQLADGCLYFVMEYLDGGDLTQFKGQALDLSKVLRFACQIAEGLAFVHGEKIIHRDIKPANILFRNNGSLVLTDFGIAKNTLQDGGLTQTGGSVGSPSYSSPEQTTERDVDHRTDIYSLGVVLLELLLGYNPFKGDSITETAVNHLQMNVPDLPSELEACEDLLGRMLAKNPADRFASACELLIAINKVAVHSSNQSDDTLITHNPSAIIRGKYYLEAVGDWRLVKSSALSIFAVVCFVGIVFFFTYESESDKKIKRLLLDSKLSIKEARFESPKSNNAHYYLSEILLLEPDNKEAIAGLKALRGVQVTHYLKAAERSVEEGRWSEPESNNAIYYYSRVLLVESNNVDAKNGMRALAVLHVQLVQQAFSEQRYREGFQFLRLGLELDSENIVLTKLKEDYRHQSNAFKRLFNRVFK